jgi:hypothetical protein
VLWITFGMGFSGRTRVKSQIQSILIITKARDNHLIKLTRELALYLMRTPRQGRSRGLIVSVPLVTAVRNLCCQD